MVPLFCQAPSQFAMPASGPPGPQPWTPRLSNMTVGARKSSLPLFDGEVPSLRSMGLPPRRVDEIWPGPFRASRPVQAAGRLHGVPSKTGRDHSWGLTGCLRNVPCDLRSLRALRRANGLFVNGGRGRGWGRKHETLPNFCSNQ